MTPQHRPQAPRAQTWRALDKLRSGPAGRLIWPPLHGPVTHTFLPRKRGASLTAFSWHAQAYPGRHGMGPAHPEHEIGVALHSLQVGQTVQVKGPFGSFHYQPSKYKAIGERCHLPTARSHCWLSCAHSIRARGKTLRMGFCILQPCKYKAIGERCESSS